MRWAGLLITLALVLPVMAREQALTLYQLVEGVLAHHPEVALQQNLRRRNQALLQQARGLYDWNIYAEGGYRRPSVPATNDGNLTSDTATDEVYHLALGAERRLRSGITIAPGFSYAQNQDEEGSEVLAESVPLGHLAVTVPLMRGSGTAAASDEQVAEREYQATVQSGERAIAIALIEVVESYWRTLAMGEEISALKRGAEAAEEVNERLRRLSQRGEATLLDYQRSQANLNVRRIELEKAQIAWEEVRWGLARLLGEGADEVVPRPVTAFPITQGQDEALDLAALHRLALRQRRDLGALESQLAGARLNLARMRNESEPQLDLNLDLDRIFLSYRQSLSGTLAQGRVGEHSATVTKLALALAERRRVVGDEVRQAVQALRLNRSSYQRAAQSRDLLRDSVQVVRQQSEQGVIPFTDYLTALDSLAQIERLLTDAAVEHAVALARLRLATGTLPVNEGVTAKQLAELLVALPLVE